jgi:GNAT superfamily N-acetyltransferase
MAATDGLCGEPARIEALQPTDAEAVWPLSREVGWNQLASDWRLMLTLGRAFAIRDGEGAFIASALVLPLGPALAWISMVIVAQRARGRGLGRRLLLHCLADVAAAGAAAGLDATAAGRKLYLPLGFRDLYPLTRWELRRAPPVLEAPAGVRMVRPQGDAIARMQAYDRAGSGMCRGEILAELMTRAPRLARLAEDRGGRVVGFALARDGYRATHLGPVVADTEPIALALMSSAIQGASTAVIADVPDGHRKIAHWLRTASGTPARNFTRMLLGENAAIAQPAAVFALAGPELG